MKRITLIALCLLVFASIANGKDEPAPLRVFIRAGVKTHGPGQHDHPRFLTEWKQLLKERGAVADGSLEFPTSQQLEKTDVMVMYCRHGGAMSPEQRAMVERYVKRGGGIVVIHDAIVAGKDASWFKTIVGGAWQDGTARWLEGPMSLYYVDRDHPISRGASNFDVRDEIYYDLDMMPEARVLAASYTPKIPNNKRARQRGGSRSVTIYDIQPQLWTYERTLDGGKPYRAFVCILGHNHTTFSLPHFRAMLLRGIAWAGKRANADSLCSKDELASLMYPEGGPTAPKEAAKKLVAHPDFDINLAAAEPLINNPININWDPAGRLWVTETPEYPNGRRGTTSQLKGAEWKDSGSLSPVTQRPATDRLSIMIDTDGDGNADGKQVFFEGLELATGFVFYRDGVIVTQAPDVLRLRDTDGDGKADKVEKLYTGLGIGDTHAVINNPRWGYDGWIYATHGYSGSRNVTSGDGKLSFGRIGSGVVRFKPDGSAFEQFCSKGGNTWGLDIAWDGEVFFTQPTSGDLLNHVVLGENVLARAGVTGTPSFRACIRGRPSFPLIKYSQLPYIQVDQVGRFTASAGCAIYAGGAWPSEWNYSYFTTEPTINLIHHEAVTSEGSTYIANKTREPEFIAARDWWFRPIETRIGPDGALYVVDFYNQAVAHNDTRGPTHNTVHAAVRPDRDHYFGRIYRVQHKQATSNAVPDLTRADAKQLVAALEHPNLHVRRTAFRLLVESQDVGVVESLRSLARSRKPAESRVLAIWALKLLKALDDTTLLAAIGDANAAVRKNALRASGEQPGKAVAQAIGKSVGDTDARVRLESLVALNGVDVDADTARAMMKAYPTLSDAWQRAAYMSAVAAAPQQFITGALAAEKPAESVDLIRRLTQQVALKDDGGKQAGDLVVLISSASGSDSLKAIALNELTQTLKPNRVPTWSATLRTALSQLLSSNNPALATAALPLAARWDKKGELSSDTRKLMATLTARMNDKSRSEDERAQLITSLLAVRHLDKDIVPTTGRMLTSTAPGTGSEKFKRRIIDALGQTSDNEAGKQLVAAYATLDQSLQNAAFDHISKRASWSMALLDAIDSGKVDVRALGPAKIDKLRRHPAPKVALRANKLINQLRGPEAKKKAEWIEKLTPVVLRPGDKAKGKELFIKNCAGCHKLGGIGRDVAPALTGMGAHGPAQLLTPIIDPNRNVEANYIGTHVETVTGDILLGIIARENKAGIVLKDATGEKVIRRDDIESIKSTNRSLMPEGFEALGGEALRDLLAFVCSTESRYRFVDLSTAFTADSRYGLYRSRERTKDTLSFARFGTVHVDGEPGVPFDIVNPAGHPTDRNLVVLKGGQSGSFSKTMPRKVECKVGVAAAKLHFLGGVAGWGYPACSQEVPALRVTVHYTDGKTEKLVMKNGVEFADYIRVVDVPGSKLTKGLITGGKQLRWFSKSLTHRAVIDRLTLESDDNEVAPTIVAITVERPGGKADAKADKPSTAKEAPPFEWGKGIRTLLVGGGSSHDFGRFFAKADMKTLEATGKVSANYTERASKMLAGLKDVQVLCLSTNQRNFDSPEVRKAIFDYVDSGRGLVLIHPAVWYNYRKWPEYNRVIVGGGSRGHDKLGPFKIKVTNADHPVMKGVAKEFEIIDELYLFNADPKGTKIEVLATTSVSTKTKKTHPSVWVVKHPKARIVCIAPGHDGRAHSHDAYKAILKNGVLWVAEKVKK